MQKCWWDMTAGSWQMCFVNDCRGALAKENCHRVFFFPAASLKEMQRPKCLSLKSPSGHSLAPSRGHQGKRRAAFCKRKVGDDGTAKHPRDEGTPWEWSQQSFPGQFSFCQQCFGNSHSSGTYGSFKPLSLPNNPPSWEVLILQLSAASWYSTLCASPWKSLRCHSHAAITCSSFLSSPVLS